MVRLKCLQPLVAPSTHRTARVPEKQAEPFYLSVEWRDLVAAVIRERGRRCEKCGRTDGRVYVDHIIELKDGGAALDRSNLQVLDATCHGKKTAQVRNKRMAQRHTRS